VNSAGGTRLAGGAALSRGIKRCNVGTRRASRASHWLADHKDNQALVNPKIENKERRKEAHERERIRQRNAAIAIE
jgi:hypothetical protein